MNRKIKLTPKDVLYISDVLNQLGSYNAELSEDLDDVKDKALKTSMHSICEGFSEQKHGAVVWLTKEEAKRLEERWP